MTHHSIPSCVCPRLPFSFPCIPSTLAHPFSEFQLQQQARKRQDFEKMREISAHMDNIVQRLAAFFPRDDEDSSAPDPPAVPELIAPPRPPPDRALDRSVSARVLTMDRAVSARKLTTDRAVSVASGMHFDDDLSGTAQYNQWCRGRRNWDHGGGAKWCVSGLSVVMGSHLLKMRCTILS